MTRIVLHIDRLILRGIDPSDAGALTAGIRAEVQRMLARPGTAQIIAGSGSRAQPKTANVQVTPFRGARGLGAAVAGSIVKGLRG